MNYTLHSHRNALTILENEESYQDIWTELKNVLNNITDERLIYTYNEFFSEKNKSLSTTINKILKNDLSNLGWQTESPIFQDPLRKNNYWRLDMAKDKISMEVAFNHSGVIAWNLLKPVLASELNHVQKAIQTEVGILICATNCLKRAGNFDNAVGSYENFLLHLDPLRNQLSVPLLIIGLQAPESFSLVKCNSNSNRIGQILMNDDISDFI